MLESIVAPTATNPHKSSVFHFDSLSPSDNYSLATSVLRIEFKWQDLSTHKGATDAIGRSMPIATLRAYPWNDLLNANLEQSDILIHSFQVGVPASSVAGFSRGRAIPPDLSDALEEHQHATNEAEEEGFPLPSDLALTNSERLLRKMHKISPQQYEVYPTPDAEIAIRAMAPRRSVILLCDSLGGALCLVNLNSGRRRKRYPNTDALPDSFLGEALLDLNSESI